MILCSHCLLKPFPWLYGFAGIQASLAYIPTAKGVLAKRELPRLIMTLGLFIGLSAGFIVWVFPSHFPAFFTPDQRLHLIMRELAPQVRSQYLRPPHPILTPEGFGSLLARISHVH